MGIYSWTKADLYNTKVANILHGAPFKLLIPAEFGGGSIKDHYLICGKISDGKGNQYDLYELIAFWNAHMPYQGKTVGDFLIHDANQIAMKPIDLFTEHNRRIGIDIACYDDQMDALDFPLKLVSWSYKGTYEDCAACSYTDPDQGTVKMSWKIYENCKIKYRQLHLPVEEGAAVCDCPMGGDITNDCADCCYACDYHFVNGECVAREPERSDEPQVEECEQLFMFTKYTENDIATEDLIFAIETDENNQKVAHIYAYGYCTGDGSEPDCRFVEYTFFYAPLSEVIQKGIFEVESEGAEFVKQYITDCTFEEMLELYKHYDAGSCPTPIVENQIDAALPEGTYVVQYPREKRA